MEERHHLLQPLLNQPTTSAAPPLDDDLLNNLKLISSNSGIFLRLLLVAFIGVLSIWANHEASKGYAITILNDSANAKFQLFYVSNDEATRVVIKASNFIENFLYPNPNSSIKKQINSVVVKLVDRNSTDQVVVESTSRHDQFVLDISSSVMGGANFDRDLVRAIRRGVARIWLWDGGGSAPRNLIDGIVEYLVNSLDGAEQFEPAAACWDPKDTRAVEEFLIYGERRRPGFIRRLNEAMKDGRWDDEKLGGALGLPVHKLCANSEPLRYNSQSV